MSNQCTPSALPPYILRSTIAALIAGSTAAPLAAAQASGSDEVLEEAVVSGYVQSLIDARKLKKEADIAKDVIVAEDIAKFPELNLAESLQRLPGVQINREAGEGRRISLRGLGPDYSRVQLNGMEVLGNVDSAQDSRGQRSRDRAFDFNIFASELFSRVEVEKTFQAAQNEGGMAGTVGLFTGKPFDYATGTKGAVSVKLGTNEWTDDAQPRVAALISHNWDDKFGALFSVAYAKRKTTEQGHNTYNYVDIGGGDMADMVDGGGVHISALSPELQARLQDDDTTIYWPDGNRISSWNAKMERLGVTGALQWKPADNVLLTLDALHGEFTTHRDELHLATRPFESPGSIIWDLPQGAGSIWGPAFETDSTINALQVDEDGYVTYADVTGVTFGSEHRRELNKNRFDQVALTGEWNVSDQLKFDGHFGVEKSTYKTPYDDKLYMRARGNLIADYGTDGKSASFQYPGWDPTDPANYVMDDFYYRGFHNQSKLREGVLNLTYTLDGGYKLRGGLAYHRFQQGGEDLFYDGGVNGTRYKTRGTSVADIADVYTNEFGSWLVGNYARAFEKYDEYHRFEANTDGSGGVIQDIENVYDTTEKTVSGYVQLDWNKEIGGKRFRGNVGLRGYSTDTHSTGWIQGASYAYLGTTDVKGSYSGVLPALNAVVELTPEVLLRFAATQNLNRPSLGSMAAEGTAFQNEDSGEISVYRGNPDLKPFKDTTLDLAVEYYFGEVGLLSAGVFHKDIKNLIGSETLEDVPFGDTGVPASTIPGATDGTIVDEFSHPINIAGHTKLTGYELAAQSQLSFLPAPFNNLGVVANYTYVDAPKDFTGISKTSYNGTLYYETALWGVRGSLSHRTTWYTGHSDSVMSASTRGFEGSTYVDAAAFFNITPQLQVTLDAINLTNEKDTQFWGQNQYLYNQNQSGTTYLAGVSYKF
jgi:TonB-dependent receptor